MSDGDDQRAHLGEEVLAISFAAEAGKQMLESSTSVSEVLDRLRAFLPKVGLEGCDLDATMSFLILSYWRTGRPEPLTVMRAISITSPRLEVLAGTDALLDRVENGEIGLDAALDELQSLVAASGRPVVSSQISLLVAVVGWVFFLGGTGAFTVVIALAATVLTFPVERFVRAIGLPRLATVFLIAVIVAAIPNLVSAAGVGVLIGPAVVAALYNHLPGRAFVSSVIDGLANQPLSSIARGVEALLTAGFLALGMLVGNSVGAGLGLSYDPERITVSVPVSVLGAAIGVLGIGVAWGTPGRSVLPMVAIAGISWLVVAMADSGAAKPNWVAYGIASGLVGVAGVGVAVLQQSSPSLYVGVAILPLVPGFALYTSVLALAQGEAADASDALADAGIISLAIAIGVALGLSVGRNAVTVGRRFTQSKA
jgi:uncharacterized membrane protein YjjP (DUF1212 family)